MAIDFDWKKVVGTVAPTIASALGGPLAGLAVQAIGAALGIDDASEEKIAATISGAKPEDLLKLKVADLDFKKRMAELEIDLERIHADDRQSARQREIATGSVAPATLATLVIGGWLAVTYYVLTGTIEPSMREIVLRGLGTLDLAVGMVLAYYFGSSSSSRRKDAALTDAMFTKNAKR